MGNLGRMKMIFSLCLLFCIFDLHSSVAAERLVFKKAGFSIDLLDTDLKDASAQVIVMSMPPEEGFASNVNVQVQSYEGSLDDYLNLSKQQFLTMSLKVLTERKSDNSTVTLEYSGTLHGKELHWYAKIMRSDSRIYLATATALESKWKQHAAELKACVDSLRLAAK
jgi:hypothetical protein